MLIYNILHECGNSGDHGNKKCHLYNVCLFEATSFELKNDIIHLNIQIFIRIELASYHECSSIEW